MNTAEPIKTTFPDHVGFIGYRLARAADPADHARPASPVVSARRRVGRWPEPRHTHRLSDYPYYRGCEFKKVETRVELGRLQAQPFTKEQRTNG